MVQAAAKAAGYTIQAYHGTTAEFNVFEGGAFFTDDYFNADGYASGERVIDAYLKLDNPLVIDANGAKWDELDTPYGSSTREIAANLSDEYDGVIFQSIADSWMDDADAGESTVYYIRDSSQVKSSETVTYDDDGNVIPLSERFNEEKQDIRHSDRDYTAISDEELLRRADPMKDASKNEQRQMLIEAQNKLKQIDALQNKLNRYRKEAETLSGAKLSERRAMIKDTVRAINRETEVLNKKMNTATLRSYLIAQRAQTREKVQTEFRERRGKTQLRNRIKNLRDELIRRITNPTDRTWLPPALAGTMVDVLDALDVSPREGTKAAV